MSSKFFRWGALGAFLFQAVLLTWLIADRAMLLANGEEVRLAVVPVDPRDLLRGDYVVLTYEISRLDETQLDGDGDFAKGDTIYVSLVRDGQGWRADAIHREKPSDGFLLRGRVDWTTTGGRDCLSGDCRIVVVEYGLERFFVPEGRGRALENLRNDQRVSVDIAVAGDGKAALKRLLVDDEVRYEESLF